MLKKSIYAILIVGLLPVVTSCASNAISDLYEFYPVETNTDSKLFRYQFILDPAQRRAETAKKGVPRGFAVSFADMRSELEEYMKAYPYCREGYFIYDESFDGQRYTLHGECQESK